MSTSNAKLYPKSEGWIRATINYKRGVNPTEHDVKMLCSWGKPERCEFGSIRINGTKVTAYYREIKTSTPQPTDEA